MYVVTLVICGTDGAADLEGRGLGFSECLLGGDGEGEGRVGVPPEPVGAEPPAVGEAINTVEADASGDGDGDGETTREADAETTGVGLPDRVTDCGAVHCGVLVAGETRIELTLAQPAKADAVSSNPQSQVSAARRSANRIAASQTNRHPGTRKNAIWRVPQFS